MTTTNPFDQQTSIEGVKQIILVGSGKGGVGKSSLAANLAVTLAQQGHSVGLLDADIYGPSLPQLFGLQNQKPVLDENQKLVPLKRYGVKLMSMGFLIDEGSAVVWRGPMLFKAIDQLLRDVLWEPLDYLLIDLPPGTGDVALSLAQKVPIAGAVVISTPQNMSLIDAQKSVDMFERLNVPILGFVKNMAYFVDDQGEKIELFPPGKLLSYLEAKSIELLGEVGFSRDLALCCEAGVPFVESQKDDSISAVILDAAKKLVEKTATTHRKG